MQSEILQLIQTKIELNKLFQIYSVIHQSFVNQEKEKLLQKLRNISKRNTFYIQSKNVYKISVKDNGQGIKEEDLSKLFKAFGKLEANNNLNSQGVGLGLMISNILAIKLALPKDNDQFDTTMGLHAFSEGLGQGSTFCFCIFDQNCQSKPNLIFSKSQVSSDKLFSQKNSSNVNDEVQECSFISERMIQISEPYNIQNKFVSYKQYLFPVKSSELSQSDKQAEKQEENRIVLQFSISKNSIVLQPMIECSYRSPFQPCFDDMEEPCIDYDFEKQENVEVQAVNCNQCSKILIVDDEEINIIAMIAILRKLNLTIDKAYNSKQTLEQLSTYKQRNHCIHKDQKVCQSYKMIFMDIEMAGENGISTTKRIRANSQWKEIYIVGCSGHTQKQQEEECIEAGMNDYISKPVNFTLLLNMIKQVLKLDK